MSSHRLSLMDLRSISLMLIILLVFLTVGTLQRRVNPLLLAQSTLGLSQADREFEKLYNKGNYDEAITIGERSLELREKELGREHPEVSQLLVRLAALYRATGEFAKAENAYRRAIGISEKSLGPNHPSVGAALERYACFARRRGREDDAKSLQSRALSILAPLPPGFHAGPITGIVIPGTRISLAQPSYPKLADKLGVEGTVYVIVLIDETGRPITACTSVGPEILALNAEAAAFNSRWTPTTLDKIPVRVNGQVNYNFKR